MGSAFGMLRLRRVIVHVIPQNSKRDPAEREDIQASEAVCNLPSDIRTKLQAQLQGSLADVRRPIIQDPSAKSDVPNVVRSFLAGDGANFVEASQRLAYLLRDAQAWNASAGILLVTECQLGEQAAIALVKIEREDGMRAALTVENGKKTFDMQYFPDLFFAGKSKVYKICVFSYLSVDDESLIGWAADTQGAGKKLATYFLSKYLGCRYGDDSKELTRKFYEKSEEWINKVVSAPSARAKYDIALAAEMQNNETALSVSDFVRKNIELRDRDSFVQFMAQNEIPRQPFEKDTSLISNRLDRRRFVFRGGITVTVPLKAFDNETVKVHAVDDIYTRMTITDELREARGTALLGKPRTNTKEAGD